jgi:SPP1 family predicted phage head-tail adaptor
MISAGKLDRRVVIERYGVTYDAHNQPTEAWTSLASRWAAKQDVSDVERVRAAQVGAEITTRFVVRWDSVTSTITAADRVVYGGKTYSVVGVKEGEGRRVSIEITASTAIDALPQVEAGP